MLYIYHFNGFEGKLQVYDKKTNEKFTYETSNCNAVAIGYYDYTFDKDFNKFGYEFKEGEIYKEHVLVYNDGSTLYASSPVLKNNTKTPFKRYEFLDGHFTANIDTIVLSYGFAMDGTIAVLSNEQLTSVKRNKNGTLVFSDLT